MITVSYDSSLNLFIWGEGPLFLWGEGPLFQAAETALVFSALVQYLLNDQLINVSGFGLETLILWWMRLRLFSLGLRFSLWWLWLIAIITLILQPSLYPISLPCDVTTPHIKRTGYTSLSHLTLDSTLWLDLASVMGKTWWSASSELRP